MVKLRSAKFIIKTLSSILAIFTLRNIIQKNEPLFVDGITGEDIPVFNPFTTHPLFGEDFFFHRLF